MIQLSLEWSLLSENTFRNEYILGEIVKNKTPLRQLNLFFWF